MSGRAFATLALLVALAPPQTKARAQIVADAARSPSARVVDSAPLARAARAAQGAFERTRRARLPVEYGGSGGSPGGAARIGRMYYWPDNEHDPPPEPASLSARRDALIAILDRVARAIPGDGWVAGQRVRYLSEAGRAGDALAAARECTADRAWCLRLAGYALHVAGRFAAADSIFDAALAAMPDSARCRWLGIGDVLEDDLRQRWQRSDCATRERLARRVWRAGAPLYLVGGDELRTALLTRLTRSELEADAESPRGMRWGDDLTELTLRYGWSTWFTRSLPPIGSADEPHVVGHDPGPGFTFVPSSRAVDSGWAAGGEAWPLDRPQARLRYAPDYARTLHAIPHQLAAFPRGDSVRIVAAYDLSSDTTFHGRPVVAGLFALDSSGHMFAATRDSADERGTLSLAVPRGAYVVSVEALDRADRAAARARYGLADRTAPGAHADLLLFRADGERARTMGDALARALATARVERRDRLGIYWELPPASPSTTGAGAVDMTLSLQPLPRHGLLHALGRRLGLGRDRGALRLAWRDQRHRSGVPEPRSLTLDLEQLAPGRYELRLVAAPDDGPRVESRREIDLAP